ncbi:hypothetical protein [Methyloversatilis discipulorum]|uniref:hypothetical protein n=1 Tax=Methyloversatilis discipulorum TaxID=1119528 RepID=UPI001A4FA178|nr:hypothetical protein [Methyloversatilis discipulorum]MBL8469575.1 hypothetical protein [Methyloversatilis discipulorum]
MRMHGCLAISLLTLAACASEVPRQPARFQPAIEVASVRSVDREIEVRLGTGYTRVLASGSRWRQVGAVSEGSVYASSGSTFSVEGAHVHEAYLVVKSGRLVGFYLPVERAFSPISPDQNPTLWKEYE